ncbi:hypothetical protein BDY24DRAFT_26698 [Mrakia frigida]|uniref:uncharacterized protein n=1 Tax=Mrakia frigida TaxID=29902 RepID=UPI003FCC2050
MNIQHLIHPDSALASTASLFSSYPSPSLPSTFPLPPVRPQLEDEVSQQTDFPSSLASSRKGDGDPGFLSNSPPPVHPPSRLSLASHLDSEPPRYPSSSTHRDADAGLMREEKATPLGPSRLPNSRTPSPVLSYSHSPASSSCSLQPPTPNHVPEYPPCFPRKQLLLPRNTPSPSLQHQASPISALDLLAVVADISSAGPSSERSTSPPESETASSASSSSRSRKRVRKEETDTETVAGTKRVTKKRKGRGLDPQKTRLMIFPPTLPPRSFAPAESEGYTKRPTASAENLYAPIYTKGRDSRTRVAFCERCGEGNLPTRMSGYGWVFLPLCSFSFLQISDSEHLNLSDTIFFTPTTFPLTLPTSCHLPFGSEPLRRTTSLRPSSTSSSP